ncbi:hypothetical protein T440DRAFT_278319 [Plenodomus tracheiphilus IPT5]|uniref:RING-type domain-containing protein n=1 Tax=Plenodomus tracheiphilus IPT5 TaxID=1408161 RepID=A0A6A7AST6_9PLEO|nr:hypothetical protein T440DRAFT_278319 [Plenodomus tracheiphilus IPT5]
MSAAIDSSTLTIDTALIICQIWPHDLECAICRGLLRNTPNITTPNSAIDKRVAKIKVCGNLHYLHHMCIMAWIRSATPMANTCPIDRRVCYVSSSPPLPRAREGHEYEQTISISRRYEIRVRSHARGNHRYRRGGIPHNSDYVPGTSDDVMPGSRWENVLDPSPIDEDVELPEDDSSGCYEWIG